MDIEARILALIRNGAATGLQETIQFRREHAKQPMLIVSSRLPSRTTTRSDRRFIGGASAMLAAFSEEFDTTWLTIGNDGIYVRRDASSQALSCITRLPENTVASHYAVTNSVLWPIFHELSSEFCGEMTSSHWVDYMEVNRGVATAISQEGIRLHAVINDHPFVMAPSFLSAALRRATVYFLHCCFPSLNSLVRFPWWKDLLRSLSSCAAVGFQTAEDLARFRECLQASTEVFDSPRLFVSPSTIDFALWVEAVVNAPGLARSSLRHLLQVDRVLLSVARIDPAKGIDLTIKALSLCNRRDPVALLLVTSSSRGTLPMYRQHAADIAAAAHDVNGRYGLRVCVLDTLLTQSELACLYTACDGLVVCSRREGMNLVAQEFMACRPSDPGALILSSGTGLARRFPQLNAINPIDKERVAAEMQTVGERKQPNAAWDLAINMLRHSSPEAWARQVANAPTSTV